ncbi:MAG: hypothetical protein HY669_01525 [Chloroflexi bacterium]|nr:hypothetical protein [Chloroflexota bacterium]
MNVVIPALSSIISLIFAIAVLDQYFARRKPYQLVWAIGLLMYFVSTGSEFLTEVGGRGEVVFRLWYLFGAIFVAAYLGMGSFYLLTPRRAGHTIMAGLGLASIYAMVRMATVPVNLSLIPEGQLLSGEALPMSVRVMTPFFNTFGTVGLVGGAIYSAWVFWRRRIMPHRVVSNILIAVGAILPVTGGSMAKLGRPELLYLTELLGIVIIFLGFLRSREVFGLYRLPLIHGFSRAASKRS